MSDLYGNVTSISDKIKPLAKVFEAFSKNLITYLNKNNWQDIPHYYNERATLSLFSAACWQSDMVALEEYATTKGIGQNERNGRCDLWVLLDEMSWEFEAKQLFPTLGVKDNTVRKILGQAAEAASLNYDSDFRAGLTFITPSVPKDTSRQEVEKLLKRLITVTVQRGCHGLAWWFPERLMDRDSPLRRDRSKMFIWPGVLTVVEVVSPSNSFILITESDVPILQPRASR